MIQLSNGAIIGLSNGNVITLYVSQSLIPKLVDSIIRHNMTGSIIGSIVS